MNLNEITMDRGAAREAFLEYRQAFREEANAIDGELMRGYKELAAGRQIIRLSETIKAGGEDELHRPKLAIARADEERITFWRNRAGAVMFSPNVNWDQMARSGDRVINLGDGTLPRMTEEGVWSIDTRTWAAILPIIPPRLRPPHNLSNYHVLWEAVWTKPQTRRSPKDPALLKRIGGDVFAVLAVWDLTPLEQAVLELRRS